MMPLYAKYTIKWGLRLQKGPQFVDIPLEEEDSSDEEYRPDEEEEDETAEEVGEKDFCVIWYFFVAMDL